MKSNRPNLNKQDTSVPLKLFNWDFIPFKVKFALFFFWFFVFFLVLLLILTFPNPIIFAFEFYSAANTIEFGKNILNILH